MDWNLAERYTDIMKTCFVGLFFSAILPSALFITALAMLTAYLSDKFSLLNFWKRPPMLGAKLAHDSRITFVIVVWAHVMVSARVGLVGTACVGSACRHRVCRALAPHTIAYYHHHRPNPTHPIPPHPAHPQLFLELAVHRG